MTASQQGCPDERAGVDRSDRVPQVPKSRRVGPVLELRTREGDPMSDWTLIPVGAFRDPLPQPLALFPTPDPTGTPDLFTDNDEGAPTMTRTAIISSTNTAAEVTK